MTFRADIERHAGHHTLHAALIALGIAIMLSTLLVAMGSNSAYAATPEELQNTIEQSSAEYEAATARIEELDIQIATNEAKIAGLEQRLPELEASSDEAMIAMYKSQVGGSSFFQFVMGSATWDDFILQVEYFNRVETSALDAIAQTAAARADLQTTTEQLAANRVEAQAQQQAASEALEAAVAAKEEAMRIAAEQAAAEVAAAQQQQEAAAAAAPNDAPAQDKQQDETPAASISADEVDWSQDKATYVAQWAPRIDSYLSGSPLSGYGSVFASAAWDNGVDPRWSPAITFVESSRGANCRRSYNAWGWIGHDFSSWEEGINEHVAYLARSYGSTLTMEAAAKYCPPGGDWYNKVYNQMQQI